MINHNNRNFKLVDTFPEIKQSYQGFWIHSQNKIASINRIFLFLLHHWTSSWIYFLCIIKYFLRGVKWTDWSEWRPSIMWCHCPHAVVWRTLCRCWRRPGKKPSWSHLIKGPKQITLIDAAKSGNYSSHGQLKRVLFVMSVL